ncbi:hypothetical protein L1987_13950 [Smallanthus sonchifolius]|uniref:Uncharacterized protein n=1 Tax=Smallanthus sonchifolius TaxID=185202 RepID=A0ACB9JLF1_9ASTR|nr:hypothetical protein L1987_13950 [Smallanthus sonchifolius]
MPHTGDATGLFLFLAPTITFKRILNNKSTEEFSGIPYPMTLLNCLLSAWYGLPFVSENNTLVTVINGTGAGIEAIYVLIFVIYAPKKEKLKVLGLVTFVLAAFSTVAVVSVAALHVIRTKSVEFMPFFLSLFVFLCGTSWFIFGLLGNDPFVYVCNGFGSVLGALQLILYAIYRKNKDGKPAKDGGGSGMEMGLNNGKSMTPENSRL